MAYLTESMLERYAQETSKKEYARVNLVSKALSGEKTIFLSHSHEDRIFVEGLINYLATFGIKIYVDWNDSGMPRITNRTTANRIKEKIKENNYFLILATANALASRWVPWEIGVADQMKTIERIAIVPVVKNIDNEFKGNEYLALYRCIRLEGYTIKMFEAGSTTSSEVVSWLRS